jgi:hypothetical protein
MSEQEILSEVSVERVRAHVDHITSQIPSRLAGSENQRRMAEYTAKCLREAGVDAAVQNLPALVSFPGRAELRVVSPVELAIDANTLGHSVPTLADGISGELLDVYSGSAEQYQGKDPVGKITLSELSYSPARHEKQRIAGLKGSIGAVMMNWGTDDNIALPFGSVKPVWGNPTPETFRTEMPTIPCIGIARTAGLRLRQMAKQGPVRVWFRTQVDNGWRQIQITIGEIRSPRSDDFVVLGGHQDSWFGAAATDNAAGDSCIVELARVFAKHRDKLRRGLMIGLWAGHETGTMAGSSWFVDQNWDRLREHMVCYVQIDQPACTGTTRWGASSNIEMRDFHHAIEQRLVGSRDPHWRLAVKVGDASFFGLGAPMMHAEGAFTDAELKATALANLGWWHHSLECGTDKVDFTWMADHLKVYAAYLWELLTAVVLPFRYAAVGDQFIGRLAELAPAGQSIGLAGTLEQARRFRSAAARFDEVADAWRERYRQNGSGDGQPAELLNRCMKRVSRLLVPILSTAKGTYGHDPYGYTPQTTVIPCLYDVPRLQTLAEGEERWMLETQLVRERNRVTDALVDARSLVEETAKHLG